MCKWGTNTLLRVPVHAEDSHTGEFYWKDNAIDSCIADIVQALNDAGIYTRGSCCGHGQYPGSIGLHDGRTLILSIAHPSEFEDMPRKYWAETKWVNPWLETRNESED